MQTDELLPCPFCGYKAHATLADTQIRQEEYVVCLSCFSEIIGEGAIARWNTRPGETTLRQQFAQQRLKTCITLKERNDARAESIARDARIAGLELQVFQMDNSITSHHWENVRLRGELEQLTKAYTDELNMLAQRNYELRMKGEGK